MKYMYDESLTGMTRFPYMDMVCPALPTTAAPRKKPCRLCGPLHHEIAQQVQGVFTKVNVAWPCLPQTSNSQPLYPLMSK